MKRASAIPWFAVAFVIALGVAMSALWAARLPIFLAPDEDNHYDYALTLYEAGRPLRPDETALDRDTNPAVAYLMNATHVRQQRLDSQVRADPGYGTRAYRDAIEAGAPKVDRAALARGPIAPAPYIARLYPIGYYGLLAASIALGDALTHGSVFGEFFFARALSVALLIPALIFVWLCLRELGMPRGQAFAIFICVALFPMSSWTFGSVQPDVLATLLVAAAVYVALRLRRAPASAAGSLALGAIFAALIATKQHYFAAAFVPIATMLAVRLPWRSAPALAARAAAFGALPPLAALAATKSLMSAAGPITGICQLPDRRAAAAAKGLGSLAHFFAQGLREAFNGTFGFTTGRDSFWIAYSAYRNSLLALPTVGVSSAISTVLWAFGLLVAALFVVRLARNAKRLVRVGRRRSWRSAARVATANVYVNGYLTLFVILFAFEAYIGGLFPLQGRYWLPFLPAVWIVAATLAPRALPKRFGVPLRRLIAGGLIGFCIDGSLATHATLQGRFYGPAGTPEPAGELFASVDPTVDGRFVRVRGVALDLRDASPVAHVLLSVDGGPKVATQPEARPDAVCELESGLLHSGFVATLPLTDLAPGTHHVRVFLVTPWLSAPYDTQTEGTFVVPGR